MEAKATTKSCVIVRYSLHDASSMHLKSYSFLKQIEHLSSLFQHQLISRHIDV